MSLKKLKNIDSLYVVQRQAGVFPLFDVLLKRMHVVLGKAI